MLINRILDPVIVAFLFVLMTDAKPTGTAKTRHQVLSIPGVVTVYIRPGDTPLQDINRDLAEAFDFNAVKHGRLAFGREINAILKEQEKNKNLFNGSDKEKVNDLTLKEENIISNDVLPEQETNETHVQKIPRH